MNTLVFSWSTENSLILKLLDSTKEKEQNIKKILQTPRQAEGYS